MILVADYFRILEAMTRITGTMAIMGAIMVVVMMAVVGGLGISVFPKDGATDGSP